MLAVLVLNFDPYLYLGDRAIRLETIGVAAAVLLVLVAGGVTAFRLRRTDRPEVARVLLPTGGPLGVGLPPRPFDLLLIATAAVPGAIITGRIGYVLVHLDYYLGHLAAILDPAQGSLSLSMAIVGGALAGASVVRLIDGRVALWSGIATLPVLAGLVAGKVAMVLGGSGQGLASNAPFATAYGGNGPWGSLGAATGAWPSQAFEALMTLGILEIVVALRANGHLRLADGIGFPFAISLWAIGRLLVAFTWRDARVLGPLGGEQLLTLALALGATAVYLIRRETLIHHAAEQASEGAAAAARAKAASAAGGRS